jgi:hypothetical protein
MPTYFWGYELLQLYLDTLIRLHAVKSNKSASFTSP